LGTDVLGIAFFKNYACVDLRVVLSASDIKLGMDVSEKGILKPIEK